MSNQIGRSTGVAPSNYESSAFDKMISMLTSPETYMPMKVLKDSYGPWMDWERHVASAQRVRFMVSTGYPSREVPTPCLGMEPLSNVTD